MSLLYQNLIAVNIGKILLIFTNRKQNKKRYDRNHTVLNMLLLSFKSLRIIHPSCQEAAVCR